MRQIFAAIVLLAGSAFAQTPAPGAEGTTATPQPGDLGEPPALDPQTVAMLGKSYDGLTLDEVEAFIKADGYGYERIQGQNGPYLQTATANGVSYEIWLSDCNTDATPRCAGLTAQTFFFKESPKVTLKALNDWNMNTWGMRAMIYSDGQSAVAMNVGVSGGVTGTWVQKRMRNFNYWAEAYSAFWETGNPKAEPK